MKLSSELVAILAVGVTLIGVTLMGHSGLHTRMDRMEARLTARLDSVDARLTSAEATLTRLDALDIGPRLRAIEAGQAALREGVARIEGLIAGLLERLLPEETPDG